MYRPSTHFTNINSRNSLNNPIQYVLLLNTFYRKQRNKMILKLKFKNNVPRIFKSCVKNIRALTLPVIKAK